MDGPGLFFWDPEAPACPPVIVDALELPREVVEHFASLVQWSCVIDSAAYRSAEQALDLDNPYILLSHVISSEDDPRLLDEIVRLLPARSVREIPAHPAVAGRAEMVRSREREIAELFPSLLRQEGSVVLFDQSDRQWPFQRCRPSLHLPDADYAVEAAGRSKEPR